MPEKFHDLAPFWQYIWMPLIGATIGLGQLFSSKEVLTTRLIVGRALSSGGLATGAASLLVWYPDISPVALAGIAAVGASLGTSFLEKIIQRLIPGG